MRTYDQFRSDISNLLFLNWTPGGKTIEDHIETIQFLEELSSLPGDAPTPFMSRYQVSMNYVSDYCNYIFLTCKKLSKNANNLNPKDLKLIHYCIGDLTSKVAVEDDVNKSYVFTPGLTISRISASLILLSKLPFENDDDRRQFNKLVEYYLGYDDYSKGLKPVALENPGGCYIATMVYGDYDHPQVMHLRKFRDNILLNSALGHILVKIYYFVSPYLVTVLKERKSINLIIKRILDRLIEKFK